MTDLKKKLESIYLKYNQQKYVDPDPLLFLYNYSEKKNREIAGLIAACFAYGRVEQIMKIVARVLDKLGPCPFDYLMERRKKDIENDFKNFQYRFAKDIHLVNLLWGIKKVLKRFDSLENCFYEGWISEDETILPGLIFFSQQIDKNSKAGHLLAAPQKKSACKRSLLYLRWMVREDRVDPGGWTKINPSQLIVPLDTHMHKIGKMLGFTQRRSADMKTALEITKGFKKFESNDPVKYDFCLTRFGIQRDMNIDQLTQFIQDGKKKG
jgi:uncharacterized protein (TIGR02757 family)